MRRKGPCAENDQGLRRIFRISSTCILIFSQAAITLQSKAIHRAQEASTQEGRRPVTAGDCIGMTKLGDPSYWYGAPSRGLVAKFSPDGEKFVVVLRRGNLEQNTNDYSLLLWKTDDLFRSPDPDVLLTMSSSSNRPAIQNVKWLADNETVVFIGENVRELPELYAFNVQTRIRKRLSDSQMNIVSYDVTPNGDRTAYLTDRPELALFDEKALREGAVIPHGQLFDSFAAGLKLQSWEQSKLLFLTGGTAHARRVEGAEGIQYGTAGGSIPLISPNGRYVVLLFQVQIVPTAWKEYTNKGLKGWISQKLIENQHSYLSRYELIDTTTGERQVLLDSPVLAWDTEVAWAPDSGSVVIANAFLPLDNTQGEERRERQSKRFAVEVKVPTGELSKISGEDLKLLGWDERNNQVTFEAGRPLSTPEVGPKVLFHKYGDKWEKTSNSLPDDPQPEIVLEEDPSDAPKIAAVDSASHRHATLLDLNPQFKDLKFGRVEEIRWKGSDKRFSAGGLYYPVNYVPGKKYPLVIQTHGWTSKRFYIDGVFTTAFAAQPLAGKNIMVLQMGELGDDPNYDWYFANVSTPNEVLRAVSSYEGAINYLDSRGIIDRSRIGIIGFSRSSYYVKYALTHSKYHFAAASITDGFDGGYFQYLAYNYANSKDMEGINGGPPFGRELKSWIKLSPAFSIDKVRTPVRVMALHPGASEWEWFAALSRLGKPVEMITLKNGEHFCRSPGTEWRHYKATWTGFASGSRVRKTPTPQRPNSMLGGAKCRS